MAASAARPRFDNWLIREGSLTRRMLAVAALWITTLLLIGGFVLDRAVSRIIVDAFDERLNGVVTALIASAEVGPEGELRLSRPISDQRFYEPYSGFYWQVSLGEQEPMRSRSLWDRALRPSPSDASKQVIAYDSEQFRGEPLRVIERDAQLPGSDGLVHFQAAQSRAALDAQLARVRATVMWSLGVLGLGLIGLAALQTAYGLWPLRGLSDQIALIRSGDARRVRSDFPSEVSAMVGELNELLEHTEAQAEAARMHAGNLAHALKTPMAVMMNETIGQPGALAESVRSQLAVMRRHVDHHLARARALGRRAAVHARAPVATSLAGLNRAIERIYPDVTIDVSGGEGVDFLGERQDFEEMVGNLIDNAAKYGGGRVFVSVEAEDAMLTVIVEDDGKGIDTAARTQLFERGARLDTGKPGTGLGLAIVKDVAEIYGGSVALGTSEELGGLEVRLTLPRALHA